MHMLSARHTSVFLGSCFQKAFIEPGRPTLKVDSTKEKEGKARGMPKLYFLCFV